MESSDLTPLEYILLKKPEIFVYRIPPREASGYRAEVWKDSIWRGRLIVVGKGDECIIKLLESDSDNLFAQCIVTKDIETAVEKTIDSSRYFALRLDDGRGRHAFVGLGFVERNDAFDFSCCLQDYLTRIIEPSTTSTHAVPCGDTGKYKLKEGEQLQIQIKNLPQKQKRHTQADAASTEDRSLNNFDKTQNTNNNIPLLPPPPAAANIGKRSRPTSPPQTTLVQENESAFETNEQTDDHDDNLFNDSAFA